MWVEGGRVVREKVDGASDPDAMAFVIDDDGIDGVPVIAHLYLSTV